MPGTDTPWLLDESLIVAAGITIAAIVVMPTTFHRGITSRNLRASMTLFHVVFAAWIILRQLARVHSAAQRAARRTGGGAD